MRRRFQENEAIGEYRVVRFLGEGGMGVVYQGVHAKLNRPAAIKVLNSQATADASFTSRFFNEAQLQASLHHKNVAALYDFSEINGQLFIFMEFVDGESLEDLVARRAFTVEDALKTFESVCEAIAFIHGTGIIHRDIKSQNIKLTANGTVKMLDFGIAKSAAATNNLTQAGGVIGTPHYLPPEQIEGKPATAQTDVWALGVLLYEMLTGKLPFESDTLGALCHQITTAKFTAPEALNPAVPRDVSRIVARCLKRNTAERYFSVEEILTDVRRVLSGEKQSSVSHGKTFGFFGKSENKARAAQSDSFDASSGDYSIARSGNDYAATDYYAGGALEKKKLPVGLIAGVSAVAVVVLFAVVGIGVWMLGGKKDVNDVNKTYNGGDARFIVNGKSLPSNQAVVQSSGGVGSSGGFGATRKVKIDVDEGRAEVVRGGGVVGTTPFELEAKDGEKVDVTLRREGFEDKPVSLEIKGNKQVYTFSLKQK
jgi:serine/threonine protein kinase